MSDPLSLSTRPGFSAVRGKHIGKLPIIIAITLVVVLIGGIIFGAVSRMNRSNDVVTQTPPDATNSDDNGVVEPAQAFVISDDDDEDFMEEVDPNENAIISPILGGRGVRPAIRDDAIAEFRKQQRLEDLKARNAGRLSTSKINFNTTKEVAEPPPIDTRNTDESGTGGSRRNGDPSLQRELLSQLGRRAGLGDQNKQADKIAFVNTDKSVTEYSPNTVIPPLSRFEIKTGTVIPGLLLTDLNSDLPGMIIGQVRANVYDSARGKHVLIPQGSKLIGAYDSKITYGQNRALVVWRRIVFPNGASVTLSNMVGTDRSGASGFKDKVNKHYSRLFGNIFGLSVFQSIPSLITSDSTAPSGATPSELEKIIAANLSKTGEKMTEKNLGIQPTIKIRAGYRFNVLVNKDILFAGAYRR